jgi:hypothetical protein
MNNNDSSSPFSTPNDLYDRHSRNDCRLLAVIIIIIIILIVFI